MQKRQNANQLHKKSRKEIYLMKRRRCHEKYRVWHGEGGRFSLAPFKHKHKKRFCAYMKVASAYDSGFFNNAYVARMAFFCLAKEGAVSEVVTQI